MNANHLAWAKQHDWFQDSVEIRPNRYAILTRHELGLASGEVHFSFPGLKVWAGY